MLMSDSDVWRYRRKVAGELPEPLLSSSRHDWKCVGVDLFETAGFDVVLEPRCHIVSLQLRACKRLVQSRCGHTTTSAIAPGDVIVTPAGPPKTWQCTEPRQWIAMRVDPDKFQDVAAAAGHDPRRCELRDNFGTRDATIAEIAQRLLQELRRPGVGTGMYVEALTLQLMIHLIRRHSTASAGQDNGALPRHKMRRAEEYIEAHLDANLTIGEIASQLSMSPYHFAHLFQQTTGKAPHQFVIERRIDRAKTLLRFTQCSITEIAHQVGCQSQAHFAVMFRRHTGMAPTQFRRET